jgi:hypothetical protein
MTWSIETNDFNTSGSPGQVRKVREVSYRNVVSIRVDPAKKVNKVH